MIDFISSESKKIIYNCIERESKKNKIPLDKTRLVLYLKEDGANGYRVIEEFRSEEGTDIRTIKELDFMGVLDVRIDFKGYSMIAAPFIQKALFRFSQTLNIPYDKISAVCYPTYKKGEIAICIFNDKAYIKQIELSELFNEQDAMQQT